VLTLLALFDEARDFARQVLRKTTERGQCRSEKEEGFHAT
jgi:hypothetical protein